MKRLISAAVILVVLFCFYYIAAVILIQYIGTDIGIAGSILFGLLYGCFMIITMGTIFTTLPESIWKYYLNDP